MKIKHIEYNGELYYEGDGTYFNQPYRVGFYYDNGKRVGDATGHYIDTQKVFFDKQKNDGKNYFIESDCLSELLCECSHYILSKIPNKKLSETHNILFLNRLSLDSEYISRKNELEALDLLFEHAEMVIYSLGSTELDDFLPARDGKYWNDYEKMLKETGWKHDRNTDFYIKTREDMWTEEQIKKRINLPFRKIKVTQSEFGFWSWFFSDISDYSMDIALDSIELDGMEFDWYQNMNLICYQYTKEQLSILQKWEKDSFIEKEAPIISLSPYFLSFAVDAINQMKEMRAEDSCVQISFDDEEMENSIDKILDKYLKIFRKYSREQGIDTIYSVILDRFYNEQNKFFLRRLYQTALKERQERVQSFNK